MKHTRMRWALNVLLVAVLFSIMLHAGNAHAISFGAGESDVTVDAYTSSKTGVSGGHLIASVPNCPKELKIDNFFTFMICNFEQLTSNLMGGMFCNLVTQLTPAVWAAITLAVIFFAISFMIGLTPATGREAVMFLLKITFVAGFATHADLVVEYGYAMLMGAINNGITIVLQLLNNQGLTNSGALYGELDKFLANIFHFATDQVGATTDAEFCKNAIFALVATMAVVFPMMAYIAILICARVAITFFRAIFGYIFAIVGISFLMMMAPFFITFILFKQTDHFFQKWLNFLCSFALQAIILFVFLGFIVSMNLENNLLAKLNNIVIYHKEEADSTAIRWPWQYCTLCVFNVIDPDGNEIDAKNPDYLTKGTLACKDSPPVPIRAMSVTSPDTTGQVSALLGLAGEGLISALVLALIIERMLTLIPSISQGLAAGIGAASARYSPALGGTQYTAGGVGLPGEALLDTFGAGFRKGFATEVGGGGLARNNSIAKTGQGIKDGMSALVTGRTSSGAAIYEDAAAQQSAGIKGPFNRYLTNRIGSQ